MSEFSKIEWTDYTFNPWRGCTKVSTGCKNCYAEAGSKRNPGTLGVWGPQGTREPASEDYWRKPLRWNREAAEAGVRRRIFCASLADAFEGPETCSDAGAYQIVQEGRRRLWTLICDTPHLDWQLLTKRPENIELFTPGTWWHSHFPENIWVGTSVEDQEAADTRIPHLLKVPAIVRFLSCEPLLGPVTLSPVADQAYSWLSQWYGPDGFDETGAQPERVRREDLFPNIDWVIVGGESGPKARPCHTDDVRSLVEQCRAANVPVFVKQLGAEPYAPGPDQPQLITLRDRLRNRKGGDMDEWPDSLADLRIRQFPELQRVK